jgi:hypothetical protein
MSENESLRVTILQESDSIGQRRRFGLFSSPISTAIGDDGQYKTKLRKCETIQIQETNKENLKQKQEEFSLTLLARANSISPTSVASIHWQPERSRMSTSTPIGNYFKSLTKHSSKVSRNNRILYQHLATRNFTYHPMNISKKIIQKKNQKGIGKLMVR